MDTEVIHGLSDRRWDRYGVMVSLDGFWGSYHGKSGLQFGQSCYWLATGRILEAHPEVVFQDKWSIWAWRTILWETLLLFLGWCWSGAPSPLSRTESNWPLVTTTFLIIVGFCWGASDSAMPQLARRWQHWVTGGGGFGSIYTSGQVTGSLPRCDDSSSFIHFFSDLCVSKLLNKHSHFEEPELGTKMSSHTPLLFFRTVVFTFSQMN